MSRPSAAPAPTAPTTSAWRLRSRDPLACCCPRRTAGGSVVVVVVLWRLVRASTHVRDLTGPERGLLHRSAPRQRDVDVVGVRLGSAVRQPAVLCMGGRPDAAVPDHVHHAESSGVVRLLAVRALVEEPADEFLGDGPLVRPIDAQHPVEGAAVLVFAAPPDGAVPDDPTVPARAVVVE